VAVCVLDAIFVFTALGHSGIGIEYTHGHLVKLDGRGFYEWDHLFATAHEEVINAVEGTTWRGAGVPAIMTASNDAVYIAGNYGNSYILGSNPPPAFTGANLVKFNYEGDVEWSKQYRLNPLDMAAGQTGSNASISPRTIRALASGDVALTVAKTQYLSGPTVTALSYESIRIAPNGEVR